MCSSDLDTEGRNPEPAGQNSPTAPCLVSGADRVPHTAAAQLQEHWCVFQTSERKCSRSLTENTLDVGCEALCDMIVEASSEGSPRQNDAERGKGASERGRERQSGMERQEHRGGKTRMRETDHTKHTLDQTHTTTLTQVLKPTGPATWKIISAARWKQPEDVKKVCVCV